MFSYDQMCFELAKKFLGEDTRKQEIDALAMYIQLAIENWLFTYSPEPEAVEHKEQ